MLNYIRLAALAISAFVAAYLSLISGGGLLVFGASSFEEFCLFFAPVAALPVVLIGFWRCWPSLLLWVSIVFLFFGAQIRIAWPHPFAILGNHTHLAAFMAVLLLLTLATAIERKSSLSASEAARRFQERDHACDAGISS
jgi:hypothetical protein